MTQWVISGGVVLAALLIYPYLVKMQRRREITRIFQKYIPPDLIDKLGKPSSSAEPPWEQRKVRFVVLVVSGGSAEAINQHLISACHFATEQRWFIQTLVCNVVFFIDGALSAFAPATLDGQQIAEELIRRVNSEGKALYGASEVSVGVSGGKFRKAWGAMLPFFPEMIKELAEMPDGATKRFGQ